MEKSQKKPDHRLIIYGVYTKLIECIKHYENIQTVFRTMTSTTFLAISAVIGFLFSSEIKLLPFSYLTCVVFISVLGIFVITSLGLLDLVFQERMIVSTFVEAIKLEKENPWLCQVHHTIEDDGKHHGSPHRKAIYYIGSNVCLIGIICLAIGFYSTGTLLSKILIPTLIFLALSFTYAYLFNRVVKTFDELVILAKKIEKES